MNQFTPTVAPASADDRRAVLLDLLTKCHATAVRYFRAAEGTQYADIQYALAAGQLSRGIVDLCSALEGQKPESVHRIIFEHVSRPGPLNGGAAARTLELQSVEAGQSPLPSGRLENNS